MNGRRRRELVMVQEQRYEVETKCVKLVGG